MRRILLAATVAISGAGVVGCTAPAPPYYGTPYGAYPPPQTRIQGAQAVPQAPPTQAHQMQFGPAGSQPAEYHYGPGTGQGVAPAGGTQGAQPAPPATMPNGSSYSAPTHAPDYSWIRGRLERSHIGGGAWIIRYGSVSQEDPYGGAVVLQGVDPTQFGLRSGDEVIVQGSIVENTTFPILPNPGYRVQSIQRVAR